MTGWSTRTKLLIAVIMAFVSGKLMEYTYVRKLNAETRFIAAIIETDDEFSHSESISLLQQSPISTSQASPSSIQSPPDGAFDKKIASEDKHASNVDVTLTTSADSRDEFQTTFGTAPRSSNYDSLFTIVSDPRSGAEYVMNVLDQHDSVCVSGDYPKSALLPNTMSWIPDDDIVKGCTLAYVLESVQGMMTNKKLTVAQRCKSKYDPTNDKYRNHLQRFCSIIAALDTNSTNTVAAITDLFINSYAEQNHNIFTGCSCPEASTIRGMKVSTEWVGTIPVEHSSMRGTRIIRLTRSNYFERYMTFIIAGITGQWSIQNAIDKKYQLSVFQESKYEVNIDEMLLQFKLMSKADIEMKEWVEHNGHATFWIDRSQILDNPKHAFEQMFHFLGMNKKKKNKATKGHGDDDISAFVRRLETNHVIDGSLKEFTGATLLDYVTNRDAVVEAMRAHGYGKFVDEPDTISPIHHIVLSNDAHFRVYNTRVGYVTTIMNANNNNNETQLPVDTTVQPSARFTMAIPMLEKMSPDTIVILSNGHATSLNPHLRSSHALFTALSKLRKLFQDFIPTDAILTSISDECCSSNAMQRTRPGTLFAPNGQRLSRTCRGSECQTIPVDDIASSEWVQYMRQQSIKNGWDQSDDMIHLDSTFVAGTVRNVLELISALNVMSWEDDRAVLSDFMYRFPNRIVLDYEQNVFAGRFDGYTSKMNLDCPDSTETFDATQYTRSSTALLVRSSRQRQLCTRKDMVETFPMWDSEGIPIIPVLDHIDRALVDDISMAGIDRHFDKEILYVVDPNGVWASDVIRDKYRVKPTERFLIQAHDMLQTTTESSSNRWTGLRRAIHTSGLPYFAWYGDWKDCNNGNVEDGSSIPLFTTCAMTTCKNSFPMPSYMTIIDSQADTTDWYHMFKEFDEKYKWDDKIRQVVWRGGLSENDPNRVFESQRWRLCKLVASLSGGNESMFDIGLTNIPDFLTAQVDIDASLVGGIVKGISPMNDFQKYIAVLDMDGNSWSSRFGTMLCYNSVAIKVEPAYADYWINDLIPWKHYVPIKDNLSDLLDNIAFVLDPVNDGIIHEIVLNANQWCSERFTQLGLISDMLDIWEDYVQLLDRADPDWSSIWAAKKKDLFASTSNIPLVQLTNELLE